MTADQAALLRMLFNTTPVAALSTLRDGEPAVSMVPFALLPATGALAIHVSALAGHTRDMQIDPRVALLVMARPDEHTPPQALPRVSLQGEAVPCPSAHPEHTVARAAYLARFADAAPMFDFADFSLWLIQPRSLRLVGGFAQARTLAPEDLLLALAG